MVLLLLDVSSYRGHVVMRNRKGSISLLPGKAGTTEMVVNPGGGAAFELPDDLGDLMTGSNPGQKVNVIVDTSDGQWNDIE